jgi:hypothetical protein
LKRQVRNVDLVAVASSRRQSLQESERPLRDTGFVQDRQADEFWSGDPELPNSGSGEQRKRRSAFLSATFRPGMPVGGTA